MSRIGDYNLQQEQDLADKGDYANEDCREPDFDTYTKQVMESDEYKADMEDFDAGYDEYKEKRAGLWKELEVE